VTAYYADGRSTIINARWEEGLASIVPGTVDMVFTSPPYNLGNTTGGGVRSLGHYRKTDGMQKRGGRRSHWDHAAIANGYDTHDDSMPHEEYVAWQHRLLLALWPLLSDTGAIFYNHKPRILGGVLIPAMAYVPPALHGHIRQEIIWARAGGINSTEAFYMPTHERIIVIARDRWRIRDKAASAIGDVWYVPQAAKNPHPAPFPIGLPQRAIETVRPRSVLDCHMGSGTTLRAAKNLGVPAIGIEPSQRWCDYAIEWLRQDAITWEEEVHEQASLPGTD
jgi:site-specific DNA-methyltransferase (adenine-specific)